MDIRSHGDPKHEGLGNAAMWSAFWMLIFAPSFGLVTYYMMGYEASMLYAAGVLLEKSLAVDNLFAIMAIFASFGLLHKSKKHIMHRILLWGIIGAVIFRALFLGFGAGLVQIPPMEFSEFTVLGLTVPEFSVNIIFLIFAIAILWTVKLMWSEAFGDDDDEEEEVDYSKHWSVKIASKVTGGRIDHQADCTSFFTKKNGLRYATVAFLCLVCIEVCDIIFAFDSMPVIVAVVKDPNIMLTATLVACAGLRSMYFLLMEARNIFGHLDKAIVLLLVFISFKLVAVAFGYHLPIAISVGVIVAMLTLGILASLIWREKEEDQEA